MATDWISTFNQLLRKTVRASGGWRLRRATASRVVFSVGFQCGNLVKTFCIINREQNTLTHTHIFAFSHSYTRTVQLTCKCGHRWQRLFAFLLQAQTLNDWCSWCGLPSPRQHKKSKNSNTTFIQWTSQPRTKTNFFVQMNGCIVNTLTLYIDIFQPFDNIRKPFDWWCSWIVQPIFYLNRFRAFKLIHGN